jgi:hypothetical protein
MRLPIPFRSIVFLQLIVISVFPLAAQEFRGTILGRVVDASAQLVPGAIVSVVNEATNVTVEVISNDEGNYSVPLLLPGRYTVSVSQTGFKKVVRSGIVVQVQGRVVVDFQLEVGELAESVTVTEETPLLQLADANLGQVVERQFLERMPLAGESPLTMVDMAPGVMIGRGGSTLNGVTSNAQNDISVMGGGGHERGNDITIDGIPNVAPRQLGLAATVPMADAIEEFRVQTTMFDAANGRSSGGAIAMSTRSGTNTFHGSGYGYLRNRALDANSWNNNRLGLPKPNFSYHLWGGTIGGPVSLPWYRGRDRTFFFFGFEKTAEVQPSSGEYRVPSELERQGDFSGTLARTGAPLLIYDPVTTVLTSSGGFKSRTAFPGARIPQERLSPVGLAVLAQYPLPNLSVPTQINLPNWAGSTQQTVDTSNYSVRVDHQLHPNHRFYTRFSSVRADMIKDPPLVPGENQNSDFRRNKSIALDETSMLSPTLVFSLRYGYTRTYLLSRTNADGRDPTELNLPEIIIRNQVGQGWPGFNIGEGLRTIGARARVSANDTHALLATAHTLKGDHSLKFGLDYRIIRWNEADPSTYGTGEFQFNNTLTRADPKSSKTGDVSGSSMASLLLGLPATAGGSRIGVRSTLALQSHYAGLYAQDDVKLTRNLTLNLGVRFELETPFTERFDRLPYGFDPNASLGLSAPGLGELKGGLLFVNTDGTGRRQGRVDSNNFGPRVGFSYSPMSKFVIRGGYGIFFSSGIMNLSGGAPATVASFGAVTPYVGSFDGDMTVLPGVNLNNPFPNGLAQPTGSSLGASTEIGKSIEFVNPDAVLPYVQQWQLGFQRELPWKSVIDTAYAGAHSVKGFEHGMDFNEVPDGYRRDVNSVPNPLFGVLPSSSTLGGKTIVANKLNVRYPQFTSVTIDNVNNVRTIYHSLQVRFQKRTSHGLSLVTAYTFSKILMYEADSLVNERQYRTVAGLDRPHNLRVFTTYDLPVGKDRAFGGTWPRWADAALGGWSLTWVAARTSGSPLGISDSGRERPIPLRDPATPGSVHERLGDQRDPVTNLPLNPYLDVSAFYRLPDQFEITPEPARYSWLRGPSGTSHNLTIFKAFRINEEVLFDLRAEINSPFNTPRFSNPSTNVSNPATFGTITGASGQRRIILGAKVRF